MVRRIDDRVAPIDCSVRCLIALFRFVSDPLHNTNALFQPINVKARLVNALVRSISALVRLINDLLRLVNVLFISNNHLPH